MPQNPDTGSPHNSPQSRRRRRLSAEQFTAVAHSPTTAIGEKRESDCASVVRGYPDAPNQLASLYFGAKASVDAIVSARLVVFVLLKDDTVFEGREFARMKTLRGNTCRRPAP